VEKLDISPELLDALQKLSSLLEAENGLEKTLATVVELAVVSVAGCDSAGITLRNGGRDTTTAASDDYTLEIDKIQYGEGQGPCVSAMAESAIQQIEVISEETRWPEFCRRAAEHGLRSALSLPLNSDGMAGTLNLYAKSERAFGARSVAVAEIFAKQSVIALQNAQTYAAARNVAEQLNEALKTRDVIGQAKGILMEREGISDEAAFEMLRTLSQNSNVKLRDVAQRLIGEQVRSTS
jgi:GAF domain-containing protein